MKKDTFAHVVEPTNRFENEMMNFILKAAGLNLAAMTAQQKVAVFSKLVSYGIDIVDQLTGGDGK